jgi:outer membrane lipoprotein SlyB
MSLSDTELLGAGANGSRSYAAAKPTATPPTISAITAATIGSTCPVRIGGRGTMTVGGSGGRTDWTQVGGCTGARIGDGPTWDSADRMASALGKRAAASRVIAWSNNTVERQTDHRVDRRPRSNRRR